MEHSPAFLKLVEDARARVREVSAAEVRRRLDAGEDFLLIDVREDHEWEKGRLPRAVHLGRGILERDIETAVPGKDREIILYCGGGYRSALSADSLQTMGYTRVSSLRDGFRGWKDADFPVES